MEKYHIKAGTSGKSMQCIDDVHGHLPAQIDYRLELKTFAVVVGEGRDTLSCRLKPGVADERSGHEKKRKYEI